MLEQLYIFKYVLCLCIDVVTYFVEPHKSEWLKLVAKSLTGEAVELTAKSSDTVAILKQQLQTKNDPSSWDQLLVFKKQLHNEQTLADAGVTDGTILNVVLCPRQSIFLLNRF